MTLRENPDFEKAFLEACKIVDVDPKKIDEIIEIKRKLVTIERSLVDKLVFDIILTIGFMGPDRSKILVEYLRQFIEIAGDFLKNWTPEKAEKLKEIRANLQPYNQKYRM